ncbi:MAG: glycogen debranching enzyme family protein [Desulfovibrio sp.]|nr:glycogen debranching enzyme family protein [Desulfovibrio sp.]
MRFSFDKAACQNTRRALSREWLLTNARGDYASSTILCCNTRKYHGLLVVNTDFGRHVLLSTLEESVIGGGKEFFLSVRKHPGTLYPHGHQYLESFNLEQWPQCVYRVGEVRLCREILLSQNESRLVLRYSIDGPANMPPLTLRIRPMLAFRNFHALTKANPTLREETSAMERGFGISPYVGLPSLYVQAQSAGQVPLGNTGIGFTPEPTWCHNVEYFKEQERGFPYEEDLFMPGMLEIPLPQLPKGGCVYVVVGTSPCDDDLDELWQEESQVRLKAHKNGGGIIGHLEQAGQQFCITTAKERPAVLAGYHWFDAWGRDTLISLPGLAFMSGREDFGLKVLVDVSTHIRNGLVPNMFSDTGDHAYNSVDAALWYAYCVQTVLDTMPGGKAWVHEHAWSALKAIIEGYRKGPGMGIYVDEQGLLHAGDDRTQLTWMDAQADGHPVTPRHGCPVEVNALWYNTLALTDQLAVIFNEPKPSGDDLLATMRKAFLKRFWISEKGGYLGDVWRNGVLDRSIRPNQIFAVSLPHAILQEEYQPQVVECVRNRLLTPFGLRTLSPDDSAYKGRYHGDPASRDAAYHQGTVWPWLLGHYTDALLRVVYDDQAAAQDLLETVTPLFSVHLARAGLGGISEVFDGTPPHEPEGCITQAWSVAECLRMLKRLRTIATDIFQMWENKVAYQMAHPASGDTAGVCRITMTTGKPAEKK